MKVMMEGLDFRVTGYLIKGSYATHEDAPEPDDFIFECVTLGDRDVTQFLDESYHISKDSIITSQLNMLKELVLKQLNDD